MDAQFIAVIQKLITEKGKETLFSAVKCKALLADYTRGEYNKESRLLLQAVEAGAARNIAETAELANCKALMVKKLQDDHFLSEGAAADVVGMLALVLRGDVSDQGTADEDEWEPATVGTAPQTTPVTPGPQKDQARSSAPVSSSGIGYGVGNIYPQISRSGSKAQTEAVTVRPKNESAIMKFLKGFIIMAGFTAGALAGAALFQDSFPAILICGFVPMFIIIVIQVKIEESHNRKGQ